jgi:hypothetical protein
MTVESVLETMKRLEREKADALKPEVSLAELLRREQAKLGAGVRLVPVPTKGEK